jgi:Flp pilus assembly protein TadG
MNLVAMRHSMTNPRTPGRDNKVVRRFRSMRNGGGEQGFVAVLIALLLPVVFLGFAALSVDIARQYVEAERLQKTVDAAALAGAVYLPNDFNQATAVARDVATRNGFTIDGSKVTFSTAVGKRPTQLRVTMSSTIGTFFAGALGVFKDSATRTAVAEYAGPVPMGSPCNLFGSENMESFLSSKGFPSQGTNASSNCDSSAGTYWVNIAGKNVNKARGDAFQSGWCTVGDIPGQIDGCASLSSVPNPGVNNEYTSAGYLFTVRVKTAGFLTLQGYDIAYAAVGDVCNTATLTGAAGKVNDFTTNVNESKERYKSGNTPFCSGDAEYTGDQGDSSAPQTEVTVRGESSTPWNQLDGPQLCKRTFAGWKNNTPYATALDKASPAYQKPLAEVFHRWASLCSQYNASSSFWATPGDYSVQIRSIGGGGQNRYALRAMLSGNNAGVSIFGSGKVALYNNVSAGATRFYLTRLDTGTAGKTLSLQFFDLADSTAPVTVTVEQPDSSSLAPGQPFAKCDASGPITQLNIASCSIVTKLSTHGGKWQTIRVAIPVDYKCNADTDQAKCWVKVKLSTTSSQSDTTTWTAGLDGDPVRIVE